MINITEHNPTDKVILNINFGIAFQSVLLNANVENMYVYIIFKQTSVMLVDKLEIGGYLFFN